LYLYSLFYASANEHESRIGDAWCTCIRDERYGHTGSNTCCHIVAGLMFVELVMAFEGGMDVVMLEQY
jgi:hypothetical protein